MAYVAGKDCSIKVGAVTIPFSYWAPEFSCDILNTSHFGNSWKQNIPGLNFGRLTLRGPYDVGAMPFSNGSQIVVSLLIAANVVATGTLTVERVAPVADANDTTNPVMLEVSGPTSGTWTVTIT